MPPHTPKEPDSIDSALHQATQTLTGISDSPRLDAEILLALCLAKDRTHLRAWPEKRLNDEQSARFHSLLERRAQGIPVAYLCGEKEFWSRPFTVGQGVLIPRPETETLIEQALLAIRPPGTNTTILDLGTGSGIIAITLALELPASRIVAVERCPEALAIARDNLERHHITTVELLDSDWFSAIPEQTRFDLIVSNPPYLSADDPHLERDGIRHEPRSALVAGPEGLDDLVTIADKARSRLRVNGRLLLEHGYDQAPALARILANLHYTDIRHIVDLQGHLRVTAALWPG